MEARYAAAAACAAAGVRLMLQWSKTQTVSSPFARKQLSSSNATRVTLYTETLLADQTSEAGQPGSASSPDHLQSRKGSVSGHTYPGVLTTMSVAATSPDGYTSSTK